MKALANAYFIIGTAYAGKSTMIRLLAEKYEGILCEENYHDSFFSDLNKDEYPCLCYTRDLDDWHEFIWRTPEEYAAWIDGVAKECETLELRILPELCKQGKPVFVDTNISAETLKKIAEPDHVLVMLADPDIYVRRFFERPDREKQFLYQLIMEEPDTEKAMDNYRRGLMQSSLYDGIAKLQEAMPALTDGVTQLRDGAMELSEGLQTFYDEGISKILEAVDEDLLALLNRLRAISSLSNAYQTFTGIAPDTTGTVKFIYRTEEIGG